MLAPFYGPTVLILLYLFSCVSGVQRHGESPSTLYVASEPQATPKTIVFHNPGAEHDRSKRDVPKPTDLATPTTAPNAPNISTWTTHLNDSHQQLMVHWVGEGSHVIICLARDSTPRNKGLFSPSALYISYNYGKNFTNKTESFKLSDSPDSDYAQLDKFFNHPKYPEFCVFVDSKNKKLYYTNDNGVHIYRSDLSFHPSELVFDEELPDKFVVLDKVNSNRPLHLTVDGGKTFKLIQNYVKSFFWKTGMGNNKVFYVERWKPQGNSTIISTTDPINMTNATCIFDDARDFQIKGDFMFATKQKEGFNIDLYISHQNGPFYKAEFQTELDLRKFHIADVTDKRIFVSVMHTETLANLYVSEISREFTQYNFVLSMEQILCYFPDGNWEDSWLEDVTEDSFTDLYRVEGVKGVYIASKVDTKTPLANIGPEHLVSLITFDHGVTWSPITAPSEDENGKQLHCHLENSCSLHLCQKFSQLYPFTRSTSIMSSKSAPGIIMATGVMGKSLKGIPGVYMSRDAGVTWKRILKDYYFFNYGDHGGILVAVKYFKSRGETRKILYSTNEGIDWNSYQFNADDLRIYGLMTEPGENTTTFTMFGSANDQHQWIIITIDLLNAFPRNCTPNDYKYWSPSRPNSSISCVLGARETFQRRLAHTNCYNGRDYDRPVKKELCECGRRDFECDFGFKLSHNECIRNKTITSIDPYAVPSDCQPGHFYKRTKGYRKIDGDVCVSSYYLSYAPELIPCPIREPTEFMLVAFRDKIALINLADNTTLYPVNGQNSIVAIEFDLKNNCIYWADISLDKISRQCFTNGSALEVLVDTDLVSIEGMALDWISNVLFFVDGVRKKIEAVRTDISDRGRMRVTILDSKVLSKPRGIAVHPKAGYLFWTDWDKVNPSVSRSNLDGTEVKKLFGKPIVHWPNGITIDQMSERLYWVDAKEDYIASSDLDGHYFRRIISNDDKVSHPFAVAVLKDKLYWDDWKEKSIFIADKDTGANVITINNLFSGLMDLKVFAHFTQYGSNACSYKNTSCNTMCLGRPGNTFSCLCPDGFKSVDGKCVCSNGKEPLPNMTCPKSPGDSCAPDQFMCNNGLCISKSWRCNDVDDCGDRSDEAGCFMSMCSYPMIPCADQKRCYLPSGRCDGDADCADLSDEKGCEKANCTAQQFQCDNGNCIDKKWLCDGDNDCKDWSDEKNCNFQQRRPDNTNCSANGGFLCGNTTSGACIPSSWVCDGEDDCTGGEDEKEYRCKHSTCAPHMFRCPSGKCIYKSWVCDGENDCNDEDNSDEKNCTNIGHSKLIPRPTTEKPSFITNASCLEWMFKCDNGNCLPYWWRCDGINDCGDNTDERGCNHSDSDEPPVSSTTTVATTQKCSKNQFTCSPGVCIPMAWVCDMREDCAGGEDEVGCAKHRNTFYVCGPDETPCADGVTCVRDSQLCDGVAQCPDHSDEEHCSSVPHNATIECPPGFVTCDDGVLCVSEASICNNNTECVDGSDEKYCDGIGGLLVPKTLSIGVDQSSITPSSFIVSCWMPQQKSIHYRFLPSIEKIDEGIWKNMTWTDDSIYKFTGLEPYTDYNVTFYISDSKTNRTYASNHYASTTTTEGVPSPPVRLTVRQLTGSRVSVIWDPPRAPQGKIRFYSVYYSPPLPPIEVMALNTSVIVSGYFQPNKNYSFWVVASNGDHVSESSQVSYITFDDVGDVDDLVNVSMARPNDSAVYLEWHKIRGIEGFIIEQRMPSNYAKPAQIKTKFTNITLPDLPPGIEMYIDIMAYKGNIIGKPFSIKLTTQGEQHESLNLTVIFMKDKKDTVQLVWNAPTAEKYKNKKITYEIYYASLMRKLTVGDQNTDMVQTTDTKIFIGKLHACENYIFTVGIKGGPLATPVEIITRENPKAPVKHLQFSLQGNNLRVIWRSNCEMMKDIFGYKMEVEEVTHYTQSRYILAPTRNTTLIHEFKDLPLGGRYKICVSVNTKDSLKACEFARGPAVRAPQNVMAWQSSNGHVMVNWREPETDATIKYRYQVVISPVEMPEDTIHPSGLKVIDVDYSPLLTTVAEHSANMFVSVRAVTPEGYVSDFSEVRTRLMEGLENEAITGPSTSAIWWASISTCLALVVLGGALVHLALRNRRLARSFLRFTTVTPRYDNRRGQATLGDQDDDDIPPIHGFSDDEPLVIA